MRTDQNKKAIWEKHISEFNLSDLSARKWCTKEQITEGQFWYWKANKLKKTENVTNNWVEVKTEIRAESTFQKTSAIIITIGAAKIEVELDFPEFDTLNT